MRDISSEFVAMKIRVSPKKSLRSAITDYAECTKSNPNSDCSGFIVPKSSVSLNSIELVKRFCTSSRVHSYFRPETRLKQ